MTLKPLHDRVVVSRVEAATKTPGGLFIPEQAKNTPAEGVVVAVGPGRSHVHEDEQGNVRIVPMGLSLNVGDHVIFGKYSGSEVEVGGEKFVILREEEVLAMVTK